MNGRTFKSKVSKLFTFWLSNFEILLTGSSVSCAFYILHMSEAARNWYSNETILRRILVFIILPTFLPNEVDAALSDPLFFLVLVVAFNRLI